MSLGVESLNLIPTIDPRLDIKKLEKRLYGVETVATENTYQVFPITNISASGFTVTCNPPNRGVFVDRRFLVQVTFRLTFTGNNPTPGGMLINAPGLRHLPGVTKGSFSGDAPRAYGLSNCMTNIQVSLNGETISSNLSQYLRTLMRYHNYVDCQNYQNSYTPTMLDQTFEYNQADVDQNSARNPLRGYGDNPMQCPRGGFVNAVVQSNSATSAVVDVTFMEPVYLSPLGFFCDKDKPSFIQLDTCNIVATFGGRGNSATGGLGSALWSHARFSGSNPVVANPSMLTNISVSMGQAYAVFQYMTPPLDMQIPRSLVYDYFNPIYYSNQNNTSIVAGGTSNITLNNVQLNSIPERVYIWISKRDQDITVLDTDTFAPFPYQGDASGSLGTSTNQNVLSITFNNKTGILATSTVENLYEINIRNGSNIDFRQFVFDVGSPICLKFGEDIPLPNLAAAGSRGSYNFSCTMNFTNRYSDPTIFQINALFIHSGVFTISNGKCYRNIGLLTENDVLSTKEQGGFPMEQPPAYDALGALSWGDVWNFFKKAGRAAINIGKVAVPRLAPEFTPVVEGADVIAKSIGFGKMRGGKKLSRKQMLKMLK